MSVRDYDPRDGQAFQGDVAFIPIPSDIAIATDDEIPPLHDRLIVQRGELTGHHHTIYMFEDLPQTRDDGLLHAPVLTSDENGAKPRPMTRRATAHLYRDPTAARQMAQRGLLTRSNLAIGCLIVDGGAVIVRHEEHDGIRIPPGRYLVGRQIESAGHEQRFVQD
jgi:hypothetical protein